MELRKLIREKLIEVDAKPKKYKCPHCGTLTFEGDRNHWRYWDTEGGHCVGVKK